MRAEDIDWEKYKSLNHELIKYLNSLRDWEAEHDWVIIDDIVVSKDLRRIGITFVCQTCGKSVPISSQMRSLAEQYAHSDMEKFFDLIETCPESCKHEEEEKKIARQWLLEAETGMDNKKIEVIEADIDVYCKICGKKLRRETNQYSRDI